MPLPRIAILRSFFLSLSPSRPFVLLPSVGRRSIHWSDIPLRSREERCSVGVENRARARPSVERRPGGTRWRRRRPPPSSRICWGKAGVGREGVTQPRSKSHSEGGRRPLCNTNAKGGGVGGICQVRLSVSRGIKESGGIDGAEGREREGGGVNAELQKTSLMTRANSARRLFVVLVAARVDMRCSLSSSHGRFWAGETTREGEEEDEKERLSDNPPIRPRFARLISRARSCASVVEHRCCK